MCKKTLTSAQRMPCGLHIGTDAVKTTDVSSRNRCLTDINHRRYKTTIASISSALERRTGWIALDDAIDTHVINHQGRKKERKRDDQRRQGKRREKESFVLSQRKMTFFFPFSLSLSLSVSLSLFPNS